jgi:plastocyanin
MRTSHLLPVVALGLLCAGGGDMARAADRAVHQKGRMFSVDALTVARLEPVMFVNDDTVPHNVMSASAGNAFDLGAQSPGSGTPVSFNISGTVVVICAIHPRMRLIITVTD